MKVIEMQIYAFWEFEFDQEFKDFNPNYFTKAIKCEIADVEMRKCILSSPFGFKQLSETTYYKRFKSTISPSDFREWGSIISSYLINNCNNVVLAPPVREFGNPTEFTKYSYSYYLIRTANIGISYNNPRDQFYCDKLTELRYQLMKKTGYGQSKIYNNAALDAFIKLKVKTLAEIVKVYGMERKSVEDYGRDIIKVLQTPYGNEHQKYYPAVEQLFPNRRSAASMNFLSGPAL